MDPAKKWADFAANDMDCRIVSYVVEVFCLYPPAKIVSVLLKNIPTGLFLECEVTFGPGLYLRKIERLSRQEYDHALDLGIPQKWYRD